MGEQLLFGVPVLALLWVIISLFKEYTDKIPVLRFNLTLMLMAFTAGLTALATAYQEQLMVWLPLLPEIVKAIGIFLIAGFTVLGVWPTVSSGINHLRVGIKSRLVK